MSSRGVLTPSQERERLLAIHSRVVEIRASAEYEELALPGKHGLFCIRMNLEKALREMSETVT